MPSSPVYKDKMESYLVAIRKGKEFLLHKEESHAPPELSLTKNWRRYAPEGCNPSTKPSAYYIQLKRKFHSVDGACQRQVSDGLDLGGWIKGDHRKICSINPFFSTLAEMILSYIVSTETLKNMSVY